MSLLVKGQGIIKKDLVTTMVKFKMSPQSSNAKGFFNGCGKLDIGKHQNCQEVAPRWRKLGNLGCALIWEFRTLSKEFLFLYRDNNTTLYYNTM